MKKYDFFDKFSFLSQLIGIIIIGVLAFIDESVRLIILGFMGGWLVALRRK